MAEWQDGRIRWEMYHSIPNVLLGDLLRDYSIANELINFLHNLTSRNFLGETRQVSGSLQAVKSEFTVLKVRLYLAQNLSKGKLL